MFPLYFLAAFTLSLTESRELIQVNLIWRHGDRSSRHTYPNDPYKGVWKDGIMQLTEQGMAQEYDLGLYLRSKYGHLLNEKYREGEIFIKSTDTDRTLMSAQCVAAGLYAAKNATKWDGMTSWRPFPVHSSVERSRDWLHQIFQNPDDGCPEFDNLMKKIKLHSEWLQKYNKLYADFFKNLQQYTGVNEPYTIDNIGPIYDNLFCLKANGYKLPEWADDKLTKTLNTLAGMHQGLEYTDYEKKYTKKLAKMRSGVVLEKMIGNMKKRVKGETNFSVVGYSAHDSSVGPLLNSMGAFNWIVPPYASCVMLDLYRNDDGSYFVEFFYRNDSAREPYRLSFYDCGTGCSWEKFQQVASTVATDTNTPKLCGINSDNSFGEHFLIGTVVVGLIITMFVMVKLVLRRRRRKDMILYGRVPLQES